MTRSEAEKRIAASTEKLLAAARQEILRMLARGASLPDVLEALASFRLPVSEAAKLRSMLEMEIAIATEAQRAIALHAGPGALTRASAEAARASYELTTPQIKSGIKNYLVKETRRAMASGSGASGLKRNLAAQFGTAESEMQTLANAMVAQYNNLTTFNLARTAGVKRFLYSGPVAPSTRPFCRAHAGIIFTEEEIAHMDNGQGLPVTSSCGGYNCRHMWVMVPEGFSDKDAGGRALGTHRETITVGKMSLLVDEDSKADLFAHSRTIAVETQKYDHSAEWYSIARPLAHAHDGLNEVITNSPADGVWTSRRRTDRNTGEVLSNFEHHMQKHQAEIGTRDEYRSAMAEMVNGTDAEVFRDATSYLLYRKKTNDVLIMNFKGQLETFYKWDKKQFPNFFDHKKSLDSITAYL